jgi:F-type H+-transporting ATPase subunit b
VNKPVKRFCLSKGVLALAMLAALVAGAGLRAQQPGDTKPETAASKQQAAEEQGAVDENDVYRHSPMVKKFGGMLGMSTETAATVFEVFNFAVLAVAIGYVMVKTLPKTFRKRSSDIQKELVDARTATEDANIRLKGVEDRLARLDGQIEAMRAQAEKDASAEEQRVRAAVETEKAKILAAADQEIASASLAAQRQLQKYAAELAIEQAARKLVVSAETDRLLVQGFARRLAGEDSTGGQN